MKSDHRNKKIVGAFTQKPPDSHWKSKSAVVVAIANFAEEEAKLLPRLTQTIKNLYYLQVCCFKRYYLFGF